MEKRKLAEGIVLRDVPLEWQGATTCALCMVQFMSFVVTARHRVSCSRKRAALAHNWRGLDGARLEIRGSVTCTKKRYARLARAEECSRR